MIAFHFPPHRGSSGTQRTLRFARYLPEFGWDPQVLSASIRAYEAIDENDKAPQGLVVHRGFALDTARHLAIADRYPAFAARPDRWWTWWLGGVATGVRAIQLFKPHALWSTFPIATAHAIGHTLARISGLPWIADFRDPMAQDGYPEDPRTWRAYQRIEARAVRRAASSVFVTEGAVRRYRCRYPERAERIALIENGYDEELFDDVGGDGLRPVGRPLVLLHSGIVYPEERDPRPLLQAVDRLRRRGVVTPGDLEIRFRAPVHDAMIRDLVARLELHGLVTIAPHVTYRDALREMQSVDALLVMQSAGCNEQIPAKLYEYARAGRPMLGLTDPAGDTARAMQAAGARHIAALEDQDAIANVLVRFIQDCREGRAPRPDAEYVRGASRRERTAQLASILDRIVDARTPTSQSAAKQREPDAAAIERREHA